MSLRLSIRCKPSGNQPGCLRVTLILTSVPNTVLYHPEVLDAGVVQMLHRLIRSRRILSSVSLLDLAVENWLYQEIEQEGIRRDPDPAGCL